MDTAKVIIRKDSAFSKGVTTYKNTSVETVKYDHKEPNNTCHCVNDFLHITIWPVTILIIVLFFHKNLSNLLDRIKSIKSGDKEILFESGANLTGKDTAAKIEREQKIDEVLESEQNISKEIDEKTFPLNDDIAKKILSTLWKGQNVYDKGFNNRFTFLITEQNILSTFAHLQEEGYVAFDYIQTRQYFLTKKGFDYCKKNENKIGDFSYFDKISFTTALQIISARYGSDKGKWLDVKQNIIDSINAGNYEIKATNEFFNCSGKEKDPAYGFPKKLEIITNKGVYSAINNATILLPK
jgi:hypothetical protein